MNYYERHIGDYLKDTAHLSLLEHGIYARLMDIYYTREGPLPSNIARLIGARTEEEQAGVAAVLSEFFLLEDEHWGQPRCEREIAAYKELEPERENRRENERERQRRSRERRRELFEALRLRGVVPAFDTPMQELQTAYDRVMSQPVTRDDTGTQSQSHTQSHKEREPRATRLAGSWVLPDGWRSWALAERPDLDPDLTAARFLDHWQAKPGKDGRKLDWEATWRNWVRAERPPPRGSPALAAVTVPSKQVAETDAYLAAEAAHRAAIAAERKAKVA